MKNNRDTLLKELMERGVKHTPEKIIQIAKTSKGQIIFLETGNSESGLQHILERHGSEFSEQGIDPDQLPNAIIVAITQGQVIGRQGKTNKTPRLIYQYNFNDEVKYMAVQIADNGYIVSANPRSTL